MKKILTASLVAMMAVTAANAEIASTTYVSDQTGSTVAFKAGDFGTGIAKDATNLKAAVTAISDAVAGLSGDGTGSVSDQIESALSGATADDFSESVQASLSKADNSVQTDGFETFKGENTQAIADAKQEAISTAGTNADSKINALDVAKKTATEGTYFGAYEQVDGKISMTEKAFDTKVVDDNGNVGTSAPTSAAVKSFVDTEIGHLSTANSTLGSKVASLEQWKTSASTSIADNADAITDLQAADTAMDGRVDTLEADNTTNKDNITSLQTAVKSINNAEAAGSVANKIAGVEADLGDVSAANMGTTAGTVVGAINEVAGEAAAAQAAADKAQGEVDALDGKVQTNTTNISTITTNLGGLNGVEIPAACATGRCALVMEGGEAKWETINY